MSSISRREFIAGLGASIVPIHYAYAAEPQNIVVVGAGLSGLAAAYELGLAGQNVTVLEQSGRVGGRIKTVRGHFADGAWVDVGGQTAGAMYGYYVHYCTTFGLKFQEQEAVTVRPDVLLHLKGKLHSAAELRGNPAGWPVKLHEHEKALAPFRLLSHYLTPVAENIGRVERILRPEYLKYDALSLRDFLRQSGASDAAIVMIDHTLNYNSVDTVSTLSALRDSVRSLAMRGSQSITLKEGNASLPEAFARKLGDRIQLGKRVVSIKHDAHGVELVAESGGEVETIRADKVIVAVPFTALSKMNFAPELPPVKRKIVENLPYTQIAQTYLQTKTRFWEEKGPVAAVVSDGPLERLFNASQKMQGERGLLVNWINGTGTKTIKSHDPEEHLANVIQELKNIWPDSEGQIETTLVNNWSQTYAEGAYAHYAPGQMALYAEQIPKPIGRIHFAGEHTELVAPGMEGALRSGRRASDEVIQAVDG